MNAPPISGVHETILYAADVNQTVEFYARVLGLRAFPESVGSAGRGLRLPNGAVLLIFDPEQSIKPGRGVPSHGATGPGHIALAIPPESYETWLAHLSASDIEIEKEIAWPEDTQGEAARSIYFRDPGGNSVELMAGDYWNTVLPPD